MARFFAYHDIVRGLPPPPQDILRVTGQLAELPALQVGYAVVAGSAAWGTVSVRSDIDLMVYRAAASADLEKQVADVLAAYGQAVGRRHDAPNVDITWIGAESEQLVERDNLVSSSAPIVEQHVVSEIFDRTRVRLVDHMRALATFKGDPWRTFVNRYFSTVNSLATMRREVMREYATGMAMKWRQQQWSDPGGALSQDQLEVLGHMEGFADHFVRLTLADLGLYPMPDRHADVRRTLESLDGPWGDGLRRVLGPLFDLGQRYDTLIARTTSDAGVTEANYYTALRELAAKVDVDAIEGFVWGYLAGVA